MKEAIDVSVFEKSENSILVSIVMGVYNTNRNYLIPAIESILNQTYKYFEFIIVNDCSDAWCVDILKEYERQDNRIVLMNNDTNLGITKTLNVGLRKCRGTYIARMDSDDVSFPKRIEKQVEYLESHKDVHVVSCCASIYDEGDSCFLGNAYHMDPERITGKVTGLYRRFDQERIRILLSFGNIQFTHPTVMFRKSFLDEHDIRYDESLTKAQDYAMWARVQEYRCLNSIQEVLFVYRDNSSSSTRSASNEQISCANVTKIYQLKRLIDSPSQEEIDAYCHFDNVTIEGSAKLNSMLLIKLLKNNKKYHIFSSFKYRQEIMFRIFRKCIYKCNRNKAAGILFNQDLLWRVICVLPTVIIPFILDNLYNFYMEKKCTNETELAIRGH